MKMLKNKLQNIKRKFTVIGTTMVGSLILAETKIFAASNTESIDSFINFACDWLTKIRRNNCFSRWSYVCVAVGREKMLKENQEV